MDCTVKITLLAALVEVVSCTIAGLTYMDSLNLVPSKPPRGQDPCNPLYWYPKHIPDYCNNKILVPPAPVPLPPPPPPPMPPVPVPMPPAPAPMPLPMPMPIYMPMPGPPPMPLPMPGPVPVPVPISPYAPGPLTTGVMGYPPNIMPAPSPYPGPAIQHGLSPSVNGLVSPDGALNILPFSDAYSDLLEKHKQKMIRRRLQNLLDEYEYYPRRAVRRCHRKHGCRGWRY